MESVMATDNTSTLRDSNPKNKFKTTDSISLEFKKPFKPTYGADNIALQDGEQYD